MNKLSEQAFDKAYLVCEEMFKQRGYEILEKDDERILALKEDGNTICAFLSKIATKFNNERITACIVMMNQMEVSHAIIVYKDSTTPSAKKVVESCEMTIELFNVDELQYVVTNHNLVPKHELMYKHNTVQAKEYKKKKYPFILHTDPISRFYGFQTGDVIKITRKNGFIAFRVVR